jgi:triacylglycerol lipase
MSKKQPQKVDRMPGWASAGVSILNGMVGDYLHRRDNGLAIKMAFMQDGRQLTLDAAGLRSAHPAPTGKICILVHGLCCSETSWTLSGSTQDGGETSYGSLLQTELGFTPFYLRYNTGLPIADNGRDLATLLDDLVLAYPVAIEEIVLIGHSMGGLVIRSACEYASGQQNRWVESVRRVFYLGTPHEGADLEKFAHIAAATLRAVPNPITKLIGDVLNLRSRGVKDLRRGLPLPDERNEAPSPSLPQSKRKAIPWLAHAQHYLVAGTLTEDPQHIVSLLLGDALVKLPRARGKTKSDDRNALLPSENIKVFPKVHHMALAHDPAVYQQIKQWCQRA